MEGLKITAPAPELVPIVAVPVPAPVEIDKGPVRVSVVPKVTALKIVEVDTFKTTGLERRILLLEVDKVPPFPVIIPVFELVESPI